MPAGRDASRRVEDTRARLATAERLSVRDPSGRPSQESVRRLARAVNATPGVGSGEPASPTNLGILNQLKATPRQVPDILAQCLRSAKEGVAADAVREGAPALGPHLQEAIAQERQRLLDRRSPRPA